MAAFGVENGNRRLPAPASDLTASPRSWNFPDVCRSVLRPPIESCPARLVVEAAAADGCRAKHQDAEIVDRRRFRRLGIPLRTFSRVGRVEGVERVPLLETGALWDQAFGNDGPKPRKRESASTGVFGCRRRRRLGIYNSPDVRWGRRWAPIAT